MQAVPGGANYWDLGLQEGHVRLRYMALDEERRVVADGNLTFPIPEGTMDELEQLIGNGQATVTVGQEIKTSEDFKTAGGTAFIKLTCSQDVASIVKAREIASVLANAFALHGHDLARYELDRMYGREATPPAPLEIQVTSETPAEPKKQLSNGVQRPKLKTGSKIRQAEQDPEPLRKQSTERPSLMGKNKPDFRR